MKIILLVLVSAIYWGVKADNWAVLVSGSEGYSNYRHQADVCHAYHILIENGYKPQNIIVISEDDVPTSSYNPFPGKLFNKPSYNKEGVDVYKGCKIDYRSKSVTPENFLAILRGDASAIKYAKAKVLQTTSQDRIFIYYSDHGANGLLAFPNAYLYKSDLMSTFKYMYENNRYKEIVFYLEACESGSMLDDLPNNWRIYATSAANQTQPSYAYYCYPNDDIVQGRHVYACLGDHYSINWMEDTDRGDLTETLHEQFQIIRRRTRGSQVMEWGEKSFNYNPIGFYHGSNFLENTQNKIKLQFIDSMIKNSNAQAIDSRDVKLKFLQSLSRTNSNDQVSNELNNEIESRLNADNKVLGLASYFGFSTNEINKYTLSKDSDCLKKSIEIYEDKCGKFTDYSLKYVRFLVTLCESKSDIEEHEIYEGITKVCSQ